jgi:hypothetical protein
MDMNRQDSPGVVRARSEGIVTGLFLAVFLAILFATGLEVFGDKELRVVDKTPTSQVAGP